MDRYLLQLAALRALNDDLRTQFRGGEIVVSEEAKELGHVLVAHALIAMTEATEFDDIERSAGKFRFCARTFRWSISYGSSPDPTNAKLTKRELHLRL